MKKLLLVLILLAQVFIFTGCKTSIEDMTIGDQAIFDVEADHYYIYFYKDGCSGCEFVKPVILDAIADKDIVIYAVNLHPEGKSQSLIFRKFTKGNTGQGSNGDFYVNGATKWEMLYIATTPSLIEIKAVDVTNDQGVTEKVKKAYFVANGEENIRKYLEDLMK